MTVAEFGLEMSWSLQHQIVNFLESRIHDVQGINVLVICSNDCLTELLDQVKLDFIWTLHSNEPLKHFMLKKHKKVQWGLISLLKTIMKKTICCSFPQINHYERVGEYQGLFTYKYRWLILTDHSFLHPIEQHTARIRLINAMTFEVICVFPLSNQTRLVDFWWHLSWNTIHKHA